jgi:hypothetical protein
MRDEHRIREAGTFIGYMTIAAAETSSPAVIRATGGAYANAIKPPLSTDDYATFESGIDEVIETLATIGEES